MTAPLPGSNHSVDIRANTWSTDIPQEDTSKNIKVAVRFRPLWEASKRPRKLMEGDPDVSAWTTERIGSIVSLTQKGCERKVEGRTVFHLDELFDEETHTLQVYQSVALPMVSSVEMESMLNGKHATIFAYGQTGSGKTFTMQGEGDSESGQAGIITMVTADLFRSIEASKLDFEVNLSYFEIYNEKIRDLLVEKRENAKSDFNRVGTIQNDEVDLRTDVHGNIVLNATQKKVNNTDEAVKMLLHGNARRTVAATDMNALSSRSHAVFRLSVKSRIVDERQLMNCKGHDIAKFSDFNLVDLAGSESLKATKTTGVRQREGATINKSLLALSTVIQALSQPSPKKRQHINYRDSKLTRILQPHLSGNAEIAILCCATASKDYIEETRATLKFALRAKHIQVKPKLNEVIDDSTIIRNLQSQLHQTRKQLQFTEKRLQEELAQKSVFIEESHVFVGKKGPLGSSDHSDMIISEKANESLHSKSEIQASVVNPVVNGKYERDNLELYSPKKFLDSSQCSTDSRIEYDTSRKTMTALSSMQDDSGGSTLEIECSNLTSNINFDGCEANYSGLSANIRSQISNPETIRESHGVGQMGKTVFSSQNPEDLCPNERIEDNEFLDAAAFGTESFVANEQPFRTIESLNDKRGHPKIPDEITIIDSTKTQGNRKCFTDLLKDAEARIIFLEEKLGSSESIIEAGCRDLQRARSCIRDLVERNIEMKVKLKEKGREDVKQKYEKGEIMVEQYW
eukprot:CAMPEP_0197199360 /NCGR_PEP_ID=MMETSP1423-20130617/33841_1 /TAXON_ID=476441 /ORGANISM="Pseudo-nitzschia heimii, Strain UNC1101" /LENGTH=742 /DNA_ID=CAMNT_0042653215 /DNA_START=107 /DNA_END=2333 /DNA_ORIENTATION=+